MPEPTIGTGAEAAARLLSAALQAPTAETAAILDSVPPGAWGCDQQIQADANRICAYLATGDGAEIAAELLPRYGYEGDPWAISSLAKDLTSIYQEFHSTPLVKAKENLCYHVTFEGDSVVCRRALPVERGGHNFTLASPVDWMDKADEDVPHIFTECLPRQSYGVLAGPGGGSKTTLALQIALSVALGETLVPGFTPCRRGRALFLCAEDPEVVQFRKLRATVDVLGVNLDAVDDALHEGRLDLVCCQPAPLLEFSIGGMATATPSFHNLCDLCLAREYDLIVADPLMSYGGLVDENSNSAMQAVAGAFLSLAKLTNSGIILIHHSNKGGERGGDVSQNLTRGGSALSCASRAGWAIRPWTEKDAKDAGLHPSEARRYVELIETKNSYRPLRGGRQLFQRAEAGLLVPASVREVAGAGILTAICAELTENPVNLTKREMWHGNGLAAAFREGVKARLGREISQSVFEGAIDEGLRTGALEKRSAKDGKPGSPRLEIHLSG